VLSFRAQVSLTVPGPDQVLDLAAEQPQPRVPVHRGVSIEEIARLAGHASTRTTEVVYRRELRPVITTGAEIMDELFAGS
jgi:hypothetical protein